MQIQTHSPTQRHGIKKQATPKSSQADKAEKDRSVLDRFRGSYEKLDIHLDQPEYKNIDELNAANMLGYFTQTMQNAGYPWKIHSAEPNGEGYKKGKNIGDMQVLRRLQEGQPVLFQPRRDMQLDLSSGSITALAAAGSVTGTQLDNLGRVATYSKNSHVSAGSQGISMDFGEPIVIQSLAELKLLHQMYHPQDKIEAKSETATAAQQFSYFTQKTVGSAYPWRFYTKDGSNPVFRVAKATTKGALTSAAVGGMLGGVAGGVMALAFRDWNYLKGGAAIGAAIGGVRGAVDGARTSMKGTPVNAVEALERVLEDEEVVFQESKVRSVGVPVLGKLTWFSDHGQGSSISSPEELNTFYYMQSQSKLPEKPKPEPKKEEKKEPAPTTLVIDNSVHNYYTRTTNDIGVGVFER